MNTNTNKPTIATLEARIEVLEGLVSILTAPKAPRVKSEGAKDRDYGPKSTRTMTNEDARRVIMGDMVPHTVNEICKLLGLSRGQVYSCKGRYTFKSIWKEAAMDAEIHNL